MDQQFKKPPRLLPPGSRGYTTGYGKPPEETRFKPGQSGNPKGRPKGARNKRPALNEERFKSIILDEAYRTIKVREGNRNVSVPIAQAVVRSLAINAVKGNNRAAMIFSDMLKMVEDQDKAHFDDYLKTMIDYKYGWEQEIDRCKQLGIAPPDPLPHPDHIDINFNTGEVRIMGPFCKEDIPKWEKLRRQKQACAEEIDNLKADLALPKYRKYRQFLLDSLKHEETIYAMYCKVLPDRS